jgi:hypothetical protein
MPVSVRWFRARRDPLKSRHGRFEASGLRARSVDEINPSRARAKATNLLSLYAGRGANSARVLNNKNEELYKI